MLSMVDLDPNYGRFHVMMEEVSQFGATPRGGLHRLAASVEDRQARDWLVAWMNEQGLSVLIDPIGNVLGVLDLAGPTAPLILSGSHLDSQPNGGRFDGTYGVIAACEAAMTLREAKQAGTIRPSCNIGVVSWTNEEGARFQPSILGSSAYAGLVPLEKALAACDGKNERLGEALASIGYAGTDELPQAAAYVELHVECGPQLEASGKSIGVMVGWWGAAKVRVSILGEQAHTGPTAMRKRKDALYAASLVIAAVRSLADEANGGQSEQLYTSVGRLEVEPNSPNVVPGRATLFVELRSFNASVLQDAVHKLNGIVSEVSSRTNLPVKIDELLLRHAGSFDDRLVRLAERVSASSGHVADRLVTIAAHDAIPLATLCPSVVVVTPSVGGICHHEDEFTKPEDLEAGLKVLTGMLAELCQTQVGITESP